LAKRIGAPYGPFEGYIRLVSSNYTIYDFNSSNSTLSRGYNLLAGGDACSSTKGMACSNTTSLRSTGKEGVLNTLGYYTFKRSNSSIANYFMSPCLASTPSSPP
jgi:hypothetical protein